MQTVRHKDLKFSLIFLTFRISMRLSRYEILLEVSNLSRSYGDFVAVNDVSFSIDTGEIVGLLGHNGAGKTTIMKMLTGYIEPSSGTVSIGGRPVEGEAQAVQTELGYLPENLPVYPEMSIIDYLDYAAAMRGVSAADRPAAVARAIGATELQERAGSIISTLSRGFRQRVGVAQAIVHDPKYVILDEPTNGLDPAQTQQMRTLIKALAANATVILSTHIMQEVSAVCSRAIILRSGSLVLDEQMAQLNARGAILLGSSAAEGDVRRAVGDLTSAVEKTSTGYRLVTTDTSADNCAAISAALFNKQIPVSSFQVETRDLEALFAAVNEDGFEVSPGLGAGAAGEANAAA